MKAFSAWLILVALPAAAADAPGLFEAIRAGDTAYIKAHLTKPELEGRDRHGSTALMHAAAFGNLVASITIQQIGTTGTASPDQVRRRWQETQP